MKKILLNLAVVAISLGTVVMVHMWSGSSSNVMVPEVQAQTASPSPSPSPSPPPPGIPCSPGFWKNHLSLFNQYCQAAADLPGDQFTTCSELLTALTCKGSDASCGRSAAAAALNTVSGCRE